MDILISFLALAFIFLICWIIDKINSLHAKSDPLRETGRDNPNNIRIGDVVTQQYMADGYDDPQDPNAWNNRYYKVIGWFDNTNVTLRQLTWDLENDRLLLKSTEIRERAKDLGVPHNRDGTCKCVYCTRELF